MIDRTSWSDRLSQSPLGPHRRLAGPPLLDLGLGDDQGLVGRDQGDRVLVLKSDDPGQNPAIFGPHDRGLIILADQGRRVVDVAQEVIQIGPVRPGQLGADVPADSEQVMALAASFGEDRSAEHRVGRLGRLGGPFRFGLGDQADPVAGRLAGHPPDMGDPGVDRVVLEVAHLADQVGAQIARRDPLPTPRRRAAPGPRPGRAARVFRASRRSAFESLA